MSLVLVGASAWLLAGSWSVIAGGQSQTALSPAPIGARSEPPAAPRPAVDQPSTAGGYLGSAACAHCHQPEYDSWHRTLHVQMTKPIAEAKVVGDFRPGTHLEAHGRSYWMERRGGGYFITVRWGSDPAQTFRIDYTLGARRFQGYLSKLPDGRIYVLPVFWHNLTKRWVDWKETTPVPDDSAHVRQLWNVECVNCHATNLAKSYDVASDTYATSWTEMGLGCEACHGPGRDHVALMDAWAKNPRSVPAFDGSDSNRELGRQLIVFPPRTAEPRQVFDACGYCHGNKTNEFFGFRAGDRMEDYALPYLISEPPPPNDPQGEFWTDGRASRFNRPQALTLSGCFMRGQITCTRCHTAHGSPHDHALKVDVAVDGRTTRESDELCTQCHTTGTRSGTTSVGRAGSAKALADRDESAKDAAERSDEAPAERPQATAYGADAVMPTPIPDLEAHTHHPADSPGSRCIECHMSNVNWRLLTRRRDHSFQPPVPEMTARFGVANACNTCHDDKPPEWAAAIMDKWYGNGAARRATVAMAEAFYRAGAGDTTVLPQVVGYAVDRSRGALIRASAADFARQLIAKGAKADAVVVNSLTGAAADPEPMVRVPAIRALGAIEGGRTTTIVSAHLQDPVRLVRVAAAAALFAHGVVRLGGPAGSALAAAQREWMTSLRTFPDVAGDHTELGWLEAQLGNNPDAAAELKAAVHMDGTAARPHVYLGVVAARESRFADALREFRAARAIDPLYPNIEKLIDEARRRVR